MNTNTENEAVKIIKRVQQLNNHATAILKTKVENLEAGFGREVTNFFFGSAIDQLR